MAIYYKNNLKIMILRRGGGGIDHCYKSKETRWKHVLASIAIKNKETRWKKCI